MTGSSTPGPTEPRRRAAPARRRAEPGRRPRMAGIGGSGLVAVALVVLAAVLVAVTPAADDARLPGNVPGALVDRTLLSCPEADEQLRTRTRIGLAAADGVLERLGSGGTIRAGALGEPGELLGLQRGELVEPRGLPAPAVDSEGEVAAGLFAYRTDRTGGGRRDTAVARCVEPRASWWFVGAGATLDHAAELTIANLDPAAAVVDLSVFGATGEVETVGTRGITIEPGERVEIPIPDIAPQRDDLVLHVEATRGRVAAAVFDRYSSRAGAVQGLAWLPATDRPARGLLLAGVHRGGREQTLLVGNPSDLAALVEVQISGASGTFSPAGTEDLTVPPRTVAAVDLGDLGDEAAAVRLRSRVPVVATVRSAGGGETSYAGAVSSLDEPAAVVAGPGRTMLQLTAGAEPAAGRLTGYDRDGVETGQDLVEVDATATASWPVPRGTAYVVVEPAQGSLSGAATYTRPGLAQTALVPLPVRVRQPHVQPGP